MREHGGKRLLLPAFFPDATYSTIHSLPMFLVQDKLHGVVVTALHCKLLGLDNVLNGFSGFRQFANLPRNIVILSDSGGFQVFSLINTGGWGEITRKGALFKNPENLGEKMLLTPELSQDIQNTVQSDIRVTLDIPLFGNEEYKTVANYLEINTEWARRAKARFLEVNQITEEEFKRTSPSIDTGDGDNLIQVERPLLFAVVQGGNYVDLREESARQLVSIGFDGYGFGGWPLDEEGNLHTRILDTFVRSIPEDKVAYGMGIGNPDDITTCFRMGMRLFDCVIPTRNARHGWLYVTRGNGESKGENYDVVRIKKSQYSDDRNPIDPSCECPVCANYSRAYVRFLFKNKNPVFFTLATLHNVWWYQSFMDGLASREE